MRKSTTSRRPSTPSRHATHARPRAQARRRPPFLFLASPPNINPIRRLQSGNVLPASFATPGQNFDGVVLAFGAFAPNSAPPDTNGVVGATQYVQWVNASFAVFNKTTGALQSGPTAGICSGAVSAAIAQNRNDGDPIAQYDKAANRWVMVQFTRNSPFLLCFAVSTTSDATGTYNRYSFSFANNLPDYPKISVWPDAYYSTANLFTSGGSHFAGGSLCAYNRAAMLAGTAANAVCFTIGSGGLLPPIWMDPPRLLPARQIFSFVSEPTILISTSSRGLCDHV